MDIAGSIEYAVANYFTQWLLAHPYLAWLFAHPLPSLGLLLLTIFSLSGLIKALSRGIEQIWLFLLTTPFKLIQPIFRPIWSVILSIGGYNKTSDKRSSLPSSATPSPGQIERIVDRLQSLNHEQETLLRELSTLVGSTSVHPDNDTISDTQYKNLYAKLPKLN
jgi:hypothetical protein